MVTRATARRAEWIKVLNEIKHRQEIEAKKEKDDRKIEIWNMADLKTDEDDEIDAL